MSDDTSNGNFMNTFESISSEWTVAVFAARESAPELAETIWAIVEASRSTQTTIDILVNGNPILANELTSLIKAQHRTFFPQQPDQDLGHPAWRQSTCLESVRPRHLARIATCIFCRWICVCRCVIPQALGCRNWRPTGCNRGNGNLPVRTRSTSLERKHASRRRNSRSTFRTYREADAFISNPGIQSPTGAIRI